MLDKPLQEKCGIVAIFTPKLTKQLSTALLAAGGVQHRGQHGVGLAMRYKEKTIRYTGVGLLKEIFTKDLIDRFNRSALWTLIHTRYGTYGNYIEDNLQPCFTRAKDGSKIAVIHNGEFAAVDRIRNKIKEKLADGVSDTYVFTKMLSQMPGKNWEEKVLQAINFVKGAFSLAIGINDQLFLTRDQFGIRPYVLGKLNDGWIAVSETHALDKIGVKVIREIRKREVICVDKNGFRVLRRGLDGPGNFCDFEWAYFSRPNSTLPTHEKKDDPQKPENWLSVTAFRERCGHILAKELPIRQASFVVGIPDSGITVATGYANQLRLPYRQVIIRDHFDPNGDQRLFMRDDQKETIKNKVLGKLSFVPDKHIWKNAIVVIGDDSIVRGNVTRQVTKAIFSLGAKEVHWMVGFPPVIHRCHLGVSMRTREELVAAHYSGNPKKIAKDIGATSVSYISKKGFIQARLLSTSVKLSQNPREIFLINAGCGGCTTGLYPVSRTGKVYVSQTQVSSEVNEQTTKIRRVPKKYNQDAITKYQTL